MPFDPIYIVYGVVFLGTLLLVEGIYYVFIDVRGGDRERLNRRLRMLASGATRETVLSKLLRTKKRKPGAESGYNPIVWFDALLLQAGTTLPVYRLVLIMLLIALVVFVGGFYVGLPPAVSIIAALLLGPMLPILFLIRRRRKRLKKFAEQLPDAIDLIVRSLRAGHPISVSMSTVAEEMDDPIGSEFGIAVDEMTYGLDVQDALSGIARRIDLQDLKYLLVAVNVQHGVGGNLAEVLSNLSVVIRDRFRMFKKIRALSAEGRLSAWVLSGLPFFVVSVIWMMNPDYYRQASSDPLFPLLITVGVVLLILGIFILWRLVNFRV